MILCRKPPVISIIIPVYNSERYIHRCIDSILRQTYQDYELILVDDGSTDRSGEICKSYANEDNRIIVIYQKNAGVSSARNAGLAIAKGKYITFCDSDDELLPDYLAVMINEPEEAELVIAGYRYIDENGKEIICEICNKSECNEDNPIVKFCSCNYIHFNCLKDKISKSTYHNISKKTIFKLIIKLFININMTINF